MSDITERSWARVSINSMIFLFLSVSFNHIDKEYFLSIYSVVV